MEIKLLELQKDNNDKTKKIQDIQLELNKKINDINITKITFEENSDNIAR